jgi:hypothetical protein
MGDDEKRGNFDDIPADKSAAKNRLTLSRKFGFIVFEPSPPLRGLT